MENRDSNSQKCFISQNNRQADNGVLVATIAELGWLIQLVFKAFSIVSQIFSPTATRSRRLLQHNIIILVLLFLGQLLPAQHVVVSGAHSSSNGSYATLGAAFSAINGQSQTGNSILVSIDANTTETASAVLNSGTWSSIKIFPSVSGVAITGNLSAPLIELVGATNVTIDGRVGGQSGGSPHNLVIQNSGVSGNASAIWFRNGASNDTVQYARLEGSGTSLGIIFFYNTTAATGNNNNVIANNQITNAGGIRPVRGIYSLGTSSKPNTGNIIKDNYFFDFWHLSSNSYGIHLKQGSNQWTIARNHFYETATFSPSSNPSYYAIALDNGDINGTIIRSNYIGGSQPYASGTALTKSGSTNNPFYGLRLFAYSGTQVDSNIITNISWTNNSTGLWVGMDIPYGSATIGSQDGNIIGAASGTGAIYLEGGGTSGIPEYYGIRITSTGEVTAANNTIASITTSRTNTLYGTRFYAIGLSNSGDRLIEDNNIGSTTQSNSLYSASGSSITNSTAADQQLVGIHNAGTGDITIRNNTIANLNNAATNATRPCFVQGIYSGAGTTIIEDNLIHDLSIAAGNTSSNHTAAVGGIIQYGSGIRTVRDNTIYNLANTRVDFAGHIYGIYFAGQNTIDNGVFRNFIHTLEVPNNTGTVAANIYGIRNVTSSLVTISNNIVVLQSAETATLYGLYDNGSSGTINIMHNTLYIGGIAAFGAASSYAFWSNSENGTQEYRNNILVNDRSGGTGQHYGIYLVGTNKMLIDNNNYFTGTTGVLGRIDATDYNTLAAWQGATSQDFMSMVADPQLAQPGGLLASDYIPAANHLFGSPFVSVTDDYTGSARQHFSAGAYDVPVIRPAVITVNASAGTATADYIDLSEAFSNINSGTHQGQIEVVVNSSYSYAKSAELYADGTGAANYSTVRVFPLSANTCILGKVDNLPMIDLNGASNVTIDGRVGGQAGGASQALTLRNISTLSGTTSVVRFINGASTDTICHLRIEGSGKGSSLGTLFFATSTAATGNNNNVVMHNLITGVGDSRPLNCVYSEGSNNKPNTGNIIANNEFFDFFSASESTQAIKLEDNNESWQIKANSFYETTDLTPTNSSWSNAPAYAFIIINSTSANGTIIRGNFLGGTQPLAGGAPLTKNGSAFGHDFFGIKVKAGTNAATQIDSNIISNIHWIDNFVLFEWIALHITHGNVLVGTQDGNVIGSQVGSASIYLENIYSGYDIPYYGMKIETSGSVTIANNIIGSITTNRTHDVATVFYAIYNLSSGDRIIENNTIGSATQPNSIYSQSASSISSNSQDQATQKLVGIYNTGNGNISITGNTIANLTNATTNSSTGIRGLVSGIISNNGTILIENNTIHDLSIGNANTTSASEASVSGIVLSGNLTKTVRGNTIYNLRNTRTDFAGHIYGIYFSGGNGAANGVFRNFIHSLEAPNNTTTVAANIYGIRQVGSTISTIANNIVVLQGGQTATLYGLYDNGSSNTTNNFYHNTVYVGGTATAGDAASYGIWSDADATIQNYRNNIFVNERTGGTGNHYAVALNGTNNLILEHNTYDTGISGVLGRLGATDYSTLGAWQAATGQDLLSNHSDPLLAQPGGLQAADYIPSATNLYGSPYLGVTEDYTTAARQYFSAGAYDVFANIPVVVTVNATAGTATANYADLTSAFLAINNGIHQGQIDVIILRSHPIDQSATLTASGTGSASYTNIAVFPDVSDILLSTIMPNPLIDLDGADHVTFDGRVGGQSTGASYALTLRNLNTVSTNGVYNAAIRFINGAADNTLQYLRLEGSSKNQYCGTIFFHTSTTGSGNNNNLIAYNEITNANDNRPVNSLYSVGSSGAANTGNIIRNNVFFDGMFTNTSQAIYLFSENTSWVIRGNSFYETQDVVPTSGSQHTVIYINSSSTFGNTIRGNFIGGTQPQAGGMPLNKIVPNTSTNTATFYGIRVSSGTSLPTLIDSNIIRNITWTNNWGLFDFYGLSASGAVDIGLQDGNIIGDPTAPIIVSNMLYHNFTVYGIRASGYFRMANNRVQNISTTMAGNSGVVYGIYTNASNTTVNIDDNVVENITTAVTNNTYNSNIYGLYAESGSSSSIVNIRNNTIGSTTVANSIHASSPSTSGTQYVYGIYSQCGNVVITGNTIANLTNATTHATTSTGGKINGIYSATGTNLIENNLISELNIANANTNNNVYASVGGIVLDNQTVKTVRANTISGLRNTRTDFAGHIYGIYFTGTTGTDNGVFRNFIHSLETPNNTSNVASNIYGIRQVSNGEASIANNIVVLQGNYTATINGIYDNGNTGTTNLYHNTVYLGGTASAGSAASHAFWSNSSNATQDFRNNLFVNRRSGGTGSHYAIRLQGISRLTIDYNTYNVSSSGILGRINTTNYSTLAAWKTATAQDGNSLDDDPQFASSGGLQPVHYIPAANNLLGNPYTTVTDDYTGSSRQYYSQGAYDVPVNSGRVTVNATGGIATAKYFDVTQAFNSINAGSHTGVINVIIHESHQLVQSAVLNASGTGQASYSSVKVYPDAIGIEIEGNMAAPLIDLSGASQVTFDGRVNGVGAGIPYSLTLRNTSILTTAGTSTLRFIDGASDNIVQYLRIEGVTRSTTSGVVFFSTASPTAGNNNNVLRQNQITSNATNRPVHTVFSLGTTDFPNTGNQLVSNEIFDILSPVATCDVVELNDYNENWQIKGNSFYETATFQPTSSNQYHFIHVNSTTVSGTIIRGNFIGGTLPAAGGSPLVKPVQNSIFSAITINAGTNAVTQIDSNVIANITWTNSSSAYWSGIHVTAGEVEIGVNQGNFIGATGKPITVSGRQLNGIFITGSSAGDIANNSIQNIDITGVTSSGALFYGIGVFTSNDVDVDNNLITNISTNTTSSSYDGNLYGIYKSSSGGTVNILNNTIGSTTVANSLHAMSPSNSRDQVLCGIQSFGSGTITISGNTIANLANETNHYQGLVNGIAANNGQNHIENNTIHDLSISNNNTSSNQIASVGGILVYGGNSNSVQSNIIYNLSNLRTNFTGHIHGIYFTSNNTEVSKNFIHSLSVPGNTSTSAANIYGIRRVSGSSSIVQNNIVSLTGNNTAIFHGLYDNGSNGSIKFYHNTVYIDGSPTQGSAASYGFYSNSTSSTLDCRNNILINERSGGTGKHYAIRLHGISTTTIDNNLYKVATGGVLGYLSSNRNTLADWRAATQQDIKSIDTDPQFALPGGTSAIDYIPSATNLVGNPNLSVQDDYTGTLRVFFSLGAFDVFTYNPVDVTATIGVAQASYYDLSTAFDKINDGTHRGQISVQIRAGHTLGTPAVLNASGSGAASYTDIQLFPINPDLVITGDMASPLVDLDGVTNLTIDGRENGLPAGAPYSLTFQNTSDAATAGTSTMRLINGASDNTIRYARIEGSSRSTVSGVVFLSTSTTATGNNNNIISNNKITNASGNRPYNAIYSAGTTNSPNENNTISSNEIFDFLNPTASSQGILLAGSTSDWTIQGNHFYETTNFSPSSNSNYSIIYMNNSNNNGSTIRGNYIGGEAIQAGGSAFTKIASNYNTFYGIRLNVGSTGVTAIDSNIIRNMEWSNTLGANWYGIYVQAGLVDVGVQDGNEIGGVGSPVNVSSSSSNSFHMYGMLLEGSNDIRIANNRFENIFMQSARYGSSFWGIRCNNNGSVEIDDNVLANITTSGTSTSYSINLYAIRTEGSGDVAIRNNTIGSVSESNSIHASSPSSSYEQSLFGISNTRSANVTISGNTLANLTNKCTGARGSVRGIYSSTGIVLIEDNTIFNLSNANYNTLSDDEASVGGIVLMGFTEKTVRGNTIYNLRNTRTNFAGYIHGIYYTGLNAPNNGGIYRNFIHTLEATNNNSSTVARIYGIRHESGRIEVVNNIVSLGSTQTAYLYGLYVNGQHSSAQSQYYHNTVYIDGTVSTGNAPSYGLYSTSSSAQQDYRNNLLINERTGGTGSHLAIRLAVINNITLDHNVYRVPSNGVVGIMGSTQHGSLASWKSATNQDESSTDKNPRLINGGSSEASGYQSQNVNPVFRGESITGVTEDYSGNPRVYNTIGAHDTKLAILWRGGGNGNPKGWNLPANWLPATAIPGADDHVWIEDNGNGHNPILDQNRRLKSLHFNGSGKKVELGSYHLTITDSIIGTDSDNYIKTEGIGTLRYGIADGETFTFPIGNKAYNPVTITNRMVLTDTFTARVADQVWRNGYNGDTILSPKVRRTWYIDNSNQTSNSGNGVDFHFGWNPGEVVGPLTQYTLFHYTGTQWDFSITGNSTYNNDNSLTHTGYMGSFSPFAIGTPLLPLPVTWLYFDADAIDNNPRTTQLHWATANEVNNSHFVVEWSRDGLFWQPIGRVEGAGNSVETKTYAYTHVNADRVNLYRLKQVDLDGQYAYSAIREVFFDAIENTSVTIFPNPTHHQFTVNTNYPGLVQYVLLNINGQVIEQGEFAQQHSLNANPGVYLLKIITNGQVQTKRIIVTG